ncbi:MAG: hypothetical protein H8E57_09490 [Candidatus Cloacimonetes bacterium]|nr:hypothetical protein [Candidatus Cloacimonadota bacterium]
MLEYKFIGKLEQDHICIPSEILKRINNKENFHVIILQDDEENLSQKKVKEKIMDLRGKIKWDGNLDHLREGRIWSL